ncbi:MAG: hypothetical protein HOP17_07095 [Acidobacteria bacterium]|nr:hypothetical protein [Acidobacteriota bacterium]
MFAVIYLLAAFILGDAICRRFFSFASVQHRAAAAFLTGLLFSTCFTYLAALTFAGTGRPLLWANLLFFAVAAVLVYVLERFLVSGEERFGLAWLRSFRSQTSRRPPGSWKIDVACVAVCLIFGCWLFFANLDFIDGNFNFAIKSWSDFGANLSLTQSLAVGENYPTAHPFYPGETVRYHFLFWFLAANLSFLGLNVVWAINILSLLSLLALIVMIMTFAETLFNSRVVARIAALLFFFASSSLSYLPFLRSQETFSGAVSAILGQKDFLKSGFPYRGDDWGALSVAVFSNQRQLISAVGIVLMVLIFLVEFYRGKGAIDPLPNSGGRFKTDRSGNETDASEFSPKSLFGEIAPFIFCGLLIGALPYWNSAVFVAAVIVIGSLFVLFPKRAFLLPLIGTIFVAGLPQLILLRSGNLSASGQSLFHWGYIIADPTIAKLLEYLAWTFGFKWFLILAAILLVPGSYRRLFLALSAPAIVVFLLQLSTDLFNNHKLLNIWTTLSSVYIAYAIWFIAKKGIQGAVLAVILTILTFFGAVIDLFPIHNDGFVTVPYRNDRLTAWLFENTKPSDLFLTDTILSHPILMTGRKVYLGNTLFAWTAGYDLAERERTQRKMFKTSDPAELLRMLRENNIAFVAIDDSLRTNSVMQGLNESMFQTNLEPVFDDPERKYGNLKIYRVPPLSQSSTP